MNDSRAGLHLLGKNPFMAFVSLGKISLLHNLGIFIYLFFWITHFLGLHRKKVLGHSFIRVLSRSINHVFTLTFVCLKSLKTVSEDFESVFGPATEVKEIQISPVQEGNQISVNEPLFYNNCLHDLFAKVATWPLTL